MAAPTAPLRAEPRQPAQRGRRTAHSPGERRILPENGAFSRRTADSPGERRILPEIGVFSQRNLAALATTIHRTLLLTTAQYTWARQGT